MTRTLLKQMFLCSSIIAMLLLSGVTAFAQQFVKTPERIEGEERRSIVARTEAVENQFGAAILKMEHIMSRLESKITILEEEDVDTFLPQKKLEEAKRKLESARAVFKTLSSAEEALQSDTPRESYAIVRAEYMIIRDSLSETTELLKETVTLSRDAIQRAEAERKMTEAWNNRTPIE